MLPEYLICEIERLLDEGILSQRKIAQQVGVSRGTIHAMANDRRACQEASEAVPAERCDGCGAMVQMPCVGCVAEAFAERRREESVRVMRHNRYRRQRVPATFAEGAGVSQAETVLPPPYLPGIDSPPVRHAA